MRRRRPTSRPRTESVADGLQRILATAPKSEAERRRFLGLLALEALTRNPEIELSPYAAQATAFVLEEVGGGGSDFAERLTKYIEANPLSGELSTALARFGRRVSDGLVEALRTASQQSLGEASAYAATRAPRQAPRAGQVPGGVFARFSLANEEIGR